MEMRSVSCISKIQIASRVSSRRFSNSSTALEITCVARNSFASIDIHVFVNINRIFVLVFDLISSGYLLSPPLLVPSTVSTKSSLTGAAKVISSNIDCITSCLRAIRWAAN